MSKLNFDEFKKEVVEKILGFLPESFKNAIVELSVVTKNNNLKLTGLIIRIPDSNIAPTIYLEDYYKNYENGKEIEDILEEIANIRQRTELKDGLDIGFIKDFEKCREMLLPRLINKNMNEELLNNKPYTEYEDLAIVYEIKLEQKKEGKMSVLINNDIFDMWEIAIEELHDTAIKNISNLEPCVMKSMTEIMVEMMMPKLLAVGMEEEKARELIDNSSPEMMYVITNKSKNHGAMAILDKEFVNECIETIGEDFYVLPSSIHELILIPNSGEMDAETLRGMVSEVNRTQVSREERLSDNVYRYSNGKLVIA